MNRRPSGSLGESYSRSPANSVMSDGGGGILAGRKTTDHFKNVNPIKKKKISISENFHDFAKVTTNMKKTFKLRSSIVQHRKLSKQGK